MDNHRILIIEDPNDLSKLRQGSLVAKLHPKILKAKQTTLRKMLDRLKVAPKNIIDGIDFGYVNLGYSLYGPLEFFLFASDADRADVAVQVKKDYLRSFTLEGMQRLGYASLEEFGKDPIIVEYNRHLSLVQKRIIDIRENLKNAEAVEKEKLLEEEKNLIKENAQLERETYTKIIKQQWHKIYGNDADELVDAFIQSHSQYPSGLVAQILAGANSDKDFRYQIKQPFNLEQNAYIEKGNLYFEFYADEFPIGDKKGEGGDLAGTLKAPCYAKFKAVKKTVKENKKDITVWGYELVEIRTNSKELLKVFRDGDGSISDKDLEKYCTPYLRSIAVIGKSQQILEEKKEEIQKHNIEVEKLKLIEPALELLKKCEALIRASENPEEINALTTAIAFFPRIINKTDDEESINALAKAIEVAKNKDHYIIYGQMLALLKKMDAKNALKSFDFSASPYQSEINDIVKIIDDIVSGNVINTELSLGFVNFDLIMKLGIYLKNFANNEKDNIFRLGKIAGELKTVTTIENDRLNAAINKLLYTILVNTIKKFAEKCAQLTTYPTLQADIEKLITLTSNKLEPFQNSPKNCADLTTAFIALEEVLLGSDGSLSTIVEKANILSDDMSEIKNLFVSISTEATYLRNQPKWEEAQKSYAILIGKIKDKHSDDSLEKRLKARLIELLEGLDAAISQSLDLNRRPIGSLIPIYELTEKGITEPSDENIKQLGYKATELPNHPLIQKNLREIEEQLQFVNTHNIFKSKETSNQYTKLKAKLTTSKIVNFLNYYVKLRFNLSIEHERWSLEVLHFLRGQVLNLNPDAQATILKFIDTLEEKQRSVKQQEEAIGKPLWKASINPQVFAGSLTLKAVTVQFPAAQVQVGPAESVMVDVLRANGRQVGEEFVTEVYINNKQLKFDISRIPESERQPSLLKDKKIIKQQWEKEIKEATNDEALLQFINYATNQQLLTQLPFTLLKEAQGQQLLSLNPSSTFGDPNSRIRIKSGFATDEIIYELYYDSKDKSGNLIYTMSAEVTVKKNGVPSNPYLLTLSNVLLKAYQPTAKYFFPTVYNRGYLEKQLKALSIKKIGQHRLNKAERKEFNLAIKSAIRFAAENVVDKLSCYDFERFVNRITQSAIDEAQRSEKVFRFEEKALTIADQYLKAKIRENLQSVLVPNDEKNREILKYYIKDIPDKTKRQALVEVGNQFITKLSLADFNNFLSQSLSNFEKEKTLTKAKAIKIASDVATKKDEAFNFGRKLYGSFEDNEYVKYTSTYFSSYIQSINANDGLDRENLYKKTLPILLIKTIVDVEIDQCVKSNNDKFKDRSELLIEQIANVIVPEEGNSTLCHIFTINGNIKADLKDFVNSVYGKLNSEDFNDLESLKGIIKSVLLEKYIKWRIEKDYSNFLQNAVSNSDRNNNKAYFESFELVKRNIITLDSLFAQNSTVLTKKPLTRITHDDIRYITSEQFKLHEDQYLSKIIEDELTKCSGISEMSTLVPLTKVYVELFTTSIGKNLLPISDTWMGNEEHIRKITSIIYDEIKQAPDALSEVTRQKIVDKARQYIVSWNLQKDLSDSNDSKWPDLYSPVVLHATRTNPSNLQLFAEKVVTASKDKELAYKDIRPTITKIILKEDLSYCEPYYQNVFNKNRKELGQKLAKFNLSGRQISTMSRISALYDLHESRFVTLFEGQVTKDASQLAKTNRVEAIKQFFDTGTRAKQTPAKIFNEYLLQRELAARLTLDKFRNDGGEAAVENKRIAAAVLSTINKQRYCDEQSKFFSRTFKTVGGMIVSRNSFFNDFNNDWFVKVDSQVQILLKGETDNVEQQLVKLESLLAEGREFAKNQFFVTRYILNGKLDKLKQFIDEFKKADIEYEAKLINYRLKQETDPVDQSVGQQEPQEIPAIEILPEQQKLVSQKVRLENIFTNQMAIYSNGQNSLPTLFHQGVKDKKELKTAIKKAGESIVMARMEKLKPGQ